MILLNALPFYPPLNTSDSITFNYSIDKIFVTGIGAGNPIPVVTITYKFNEPSPILPSITPAIVLEHTPGRAVPKYGELELSRMWPKSE